LTWPVVSVGFNNSIQLQLLSAVSP